MMTTQLPHSQLHSFRHQLGITLVELLLYMGLLTGFLFIMSGVFVATFSSQLEAIETAELEQDSHYLLSRLKHDMGRAAAITNPASNGETGTSLTLDVGATELTYSLADGHLVLNNGSTTEVITSPSTQVTSLAFERLGNLDGTATVTLTARLQNVTNSESREITFTIGLRP